jgi:hemerythrin
MEPASAIHQALNALNEAVLEGASPEQLTRIVDIAIGLHETRFAREEQVLSDRGDARNDAHKQEHRIILERLRSTRRVIIDGDFAKATAVSDLLYAFHHHTAEFDEAATVQPAASQVLRN